MAIKIWAYSFNLQPHFNLNNNPTNLSKCIMQKTFLLFERRWVVPHLINLISKKLLKYDIPIGDKVDLNKAWDHKQGNLSTFFRVSDDGIRN